MKNKLLKLLLWFLSPFLGDDKEPSVKRFLIFFFAYEIHNVISSRTWNLQTSVIIGTFVITIGILLGLTTYSTFLKFFSINKNQNLNQNEPGSN